MENKSKIKLVGDYGVYVGSDEKVLSAAESREIEDRKILKVKEWLAAKKHQEYLDKLIGNTPFGVSSRSASIKRGVLGDENT